MLLHPAPALERWGRSWRSSVSTIRKFPTRAGFDDQDTGPVPMLRKFPIRVGFDDEEIPHPDWFRRSGNCPPGRVHNIHRLGCFWRREVLLMGLVARRERPRGVRPDGSKT
jgi:hypothetical protein